jgi:hypothetical protein
MERICHVISDLRTSSVPGMFELYSRGRIYRLAMRAGTRPEATGTGAAVLVLLGESLGDGMDGLRDVITTNPSLEDRALVVHGTATQWRIDLGERGVVRLVPAEVHPLGEGPCAFWLCGALARRCGRRVREGWYAGELLAAMVHPDGVEGDLHGVLERIASATDAYEAFGVHRDAGRAALLDAFDRVVAEHNPERISPAESERRLALHRRIHEAALRVMGLARAA